MLANRDTPARNQSAQSRVSSLSRRSDGESVRSEFGNIRPIEGLRGVAVLWVVIFHYVAIRSQQFQDPVVAFIDNSRPAQIIVRNGFLGVDLFFLITGFLLILPWLRHAAEGRAAPSARNFYRRRIYRIVPAYYLQLVFLFFVAAPLLNPDLWRTARGFVLGNLVLHGLFLQQLTPYASASLSINGALWTLSLEMQYYLLLPLIAVWFVRAPYIAAMGFLAVALLWKALALHDLEPLIALYSTIGARWHIPEAALRQLAATQFPAYLGHFALGILCARAWFKLRGKSGSVTSSLWTGMVAAIALVGLYRVLADRSLLGEHGWILIPACMALFIWAAVSRRPRWGNWVLGLPPITWLGRISYSMYLYHLPLLLLFNRYAPASLGEFAFPAYFAVVVGVSALSFRYVEQPFILGQDRRPRHRVRFALPARIGYFMAKWLQQLKWLGTQRAVLPLPLANTGDASETKAAVTEAKAPL